MTAARYVTIWCDETPTSPTMACGNHVFGDDAKSTRAEAKRSGWVNVGTRDYCRAHDPRRAPTLATPERAV